MAAWSSDRPVANERHADSGFPTIELTVAKLKERGPSGCSPRKLFVRTSGMLQSTIGGISKNPRVTFEVGKMASVTRIAARPVGLKKSTERNQMRKFRNLHLIPVRSRAWTWSRSFCWRCSLCRDGERADANDQRCIRSEPGYEFDG